jgi:hypothetical protein
VTDSQAWVSGNTHPVGQEDISSCEKEADEPEGLEHGLCWHSQLGPWKGQNWDCVAS